MRAADTPGVYVSSGELVSCWGQAGLGVCPGGARCPLIGPLMASPLCAGSGQRIQVDLTPAEWRARLDAAVREAGLSTEVSSTDLMLTAIDDYMTSPLTLPENGATGSPGQGDALPI
jgi:hypothetical protein